MTREPTFRLYCICGSKIEARSTPRDAALEVIAWWRGRHQGPGHEETDAATARRARAPPPHRSRVALPPRRGRAQVPRTVAGVVDRGSGVATMSDYEPVTQAGRDLLWRLNEGIRDYIRAVEQEAHVRACRELAEEVAALPGWKVTEGIQRARTVVSPDAVDRLSVLSFLEGTDRR